MRVILSIDNENQLLQSLTAGGTYDAYLPEEEAHHVKNVLRLKEGAHIEVISRHSGRSFESIIQKISPAPSIRIIKLNSNKTQQSRLGALLFAVCKGSVNDTIAEKCCELGVRNLIFWQADHSVVKLKTDNDIQKKLSRWQKIAEAASKQCGNALITQIFYAKNLSESLSLLEGMFTQKPVKLCCSLKSSAIEIRELDKNSDLFCAVIGPEGDLSREEDEFLQKKEFQFISLGPYTLRAETAALSVVSSINAVFGYK